MHFWLSKPAGRPRVVRSTAGSSRLSPAAAVTPPTLSSLKARANVLPASPGSRRINMSPSTFNSSMFQFTNEAALERQRARTERPRHPYTCCTIEHARCHFLSPLVRMHRPARYDARALGLDDVSPSEVSSFKLQCGVWFIFVATSVIVTLCRHYLSKSHETGLDILIFCCLMATFVVSGCIISMIKARGNDEPDRQSSCPHNVCSNRERSPTRTRPLVDLGLPRMSLFSFRRDSVPESPPVARLRMELANSPLPSPLPSPPPSPSPSPPPSPISTSSSPPPYHIAILIPKPEADDPDAPPPSYDKAIQSIESSTV